MYGRCETDPFDQAIDVCDSCYGEFCDQCLVMTKGRKHPICHECVVVASGLRPGSKPLMRGSKKTAGARRQALQATPRSAPIFQSFDAEPIPPVDADQPIVANTERPEPDDCGDLVQRGEAIDSDGPEEPVTTAVEADEPVGSPEPPQPTATLPTPELPQPTATLPTPEPTGDFDHAESPPPRTDHGEPSPTSGFRRPRPFIDQVGASSNPAPASPAATATSTPDATATSTRTSTSSSASESATASPPITGIEWTVVPEADTAPLPRRRSQPSDGSDHSSDDVAMETTSRR